MIKGSLVVGLGLALLSVGCSGAGEGNEMPQGIQERLVYTLQISDSHKVDFYEYGYGITGTHETFPVGDVEALRLPDERERTLSELFSLIAPDKIVPDELVEADARSLVAKAGLERTLALDPNFQLPEQDSNLLGKPDQSRAPDGAESLGQVSQAQVACSGDFFNDSWGAQWFINNFGIGFSNGVKCPKAPANRASFSDQASATNLGGFNTFYTSKKILQWKQMEGDFNVVGWTQATVGPDTQAVHTNVMWNHSVAPRTVSIHTLNPWNVNGNSWRANGSSTCKHMHLTMVWCTWS